MADSYDSHGRATMAGSDGNDAMATGQNLPLRLQWTWRLFTMTMQSQHRTAIYDAISDG